MCKEGGTRDENLDLLALRLQFLLIALNYNAIAIASNHYEVLLLFLVQSRWNLETRLELQSNSLSQI
jgi:hypothetical protein